MAYPPTPPPNTRADNTPLPTNHADDHNDISDALTDIINELGSDPKGSEASLTARLATMDPTTWTAVTFQNSWTDTGGPDAPPSKYRMVGDMTHLRFSCSTGLSGTVAFTLPAGFRPPHELRFAIDGAGAFGGAVVTTAGAVVLSGTAPIRGEFQFSVTY
jgi:hypothetical protein